jgi:hypothetical protein
VKVSQPIESVPCKKLVQKVVSSKHSEKRLYKGVVSPNDGGSIDDTLLICATCGEDLNSHGYVTMNGKNYCATPSCGYNPMLKAT